ncbi:hypothetical protein BRADI_3g49286v3 [Brachypodium distachyon]|uniref:Uncharacterized protein n=1 Tax=Brachypodium distachyon TaxID=15368 RepID=A0A2K2D496_BRADI|nr:hypothetical protein BRADI_3g49286v3 [Brachypodium distachyon]
MKRTGRDIASLCFETCIKEEGSPPFSALSSVQVDNAVEEQTVEPPLPRFIMLARAQLYVVLFDSIALPRFRIK